MIATDSGSSIVRTQSRNAKSVTRCYANTETERSQLAASQVVESNGLAHEVQALKAPSSFGSLIRAVRTESEIAVAYHWGVSTTHGQEMATGPGSTRSEQWNLIALRGIWLREACNAGESGQNERGSRPP